MIGIAKEVEVSPVIVRYALSRCLQFGSIRNPAWIAAHYGSR